MSEHPYSSYSGENGREMILRDHLAVDRTIMANESSFLAYIRTALTLAVAGVSLLKLFHDSYTNVIGWVFLGLALLLFVNGAIRYGEMDGILHSLSRRKELVAEPEEDFEAAPNMFRKLAHVSNTIVHIFYK